MNPAAHMYYAEAHSQIRMLRCDHNAARLTIARMFRALARAALQTRYGS